MAPEGWNPHMEELNNRRVERYRKRQEENRKKRKKKLMVLIASVGLAVIGMTALFFLLRADQKPEPEQPRVTTSSEETPKGATVIHLVAGGDVIVRDAVVASGGAE